MPIRVRPADTLSELRDQFQHISEQASDLASRFDAASLARRPMPGSWSASECLAHLNLSVERYLPLWRHKLEKSARIGFSRHERYRLDFWGRLLVWTLEPPPRFKFPTSRNFYPVDTGPFEAILPAFLQRQRAILEVLEVAGGAPIDAIKIASPFDRRVRYSIWSSFCVTAAHERRHLWQADRALP